MQVRVYEMSVSTSCTTHIISLRILRKDLRSIISIVLQMSRHPLVVLTLQLVIFTVEYALAFVYD